MAEEDVVINILAKTISLKVIKVFILIIYAYEQDLIAVGNQNQKN